MIRRDVQMLQLLRLSLLLAIIAACVEISGCGGRAMDAVRGVKELQPEAEKHKQEIDELAKPVSAKQGN